MKRWMNGREAAEYIRVSKHTLYGWIADNTYPDFPYSRVGNMFRFDKADLDRWMVRQTSDITPEYVYQLGLDFLREAILVHPKEEPNPKLLDVALRWVSTKPVELKSKNIAGLSKLMEQAGVTPLPTAVNE